MTSRTMNSGSESEVQSIGVKGGVARRGEVRSRSVLLLLHRIVSEGSAGDALAGFEG